MHEVHGFYPAQELVHLLFPVAGGFRDDEIGCGEERTGVGLGVAIAGLDEWAETGRKHRLGRLDGSLALAAKPDGHAPGGPDDLQGRIDAVDPGNGPALFPRRFKGRQTVFAEFFEELQCRYDRAGGFQFSCHTISCGID